MAYKFRPSAAQRKEFAIRMATDAAYAQAYNERKAAKAEKRRASSKFDYATAGGNYVPTQLQHQVACKLMHDAICTPEQRNACMMVIYGHNFKSAVHHDNIHIVNEFIRNNPNYL